MKIKFCCDNGANIHSTLEHTFKPKDLGFTEDEWKELSDDEKMEIVKEWAFERFDYWYLEE